MALIATACGTSGGGNTSTSGGAAGASATGTSSGAVASTATVDGQPVLVSADGHTLYNAQDESPGHISCVQDCTNIWKPVLATQRQAQMTGSALAKQLTVVARPDGGTQLVYAGHPLYVFALEAPHQMRGDGVEDDFAGTHFQWSATATGASSTAGPTMGSKPSGSGGGGYGY
jgi:predicted lipoprotein with Yx(FWY)xxD motif